MDETTVAERRKLALRKLAGVFGAAGGGGGGDGRAAAERKLLSAVLRMTTEKPVADLVRDRLSVLSLDGDGDDDDSDSDDGDADDAAAAAAAAAAADDATTTRSTPSNVGAALRSIAKGEGVPPSLASAAFWERLVDGHLTASSSGNARRHAASTSPIHAWMTRDDRDARALRRALGRDGYAQCGPPGSRVDDFSPTRPNDADDGDDEERRPASRRPCPWTSRCARLAVGIDRLLDAGWPPAAIFAYDHAWLLVDKARSTI